MIQLYWEMGRRIRLRMSNEGWGAKVIDRLSADLRTAFPDMSGLSPRNLRYMRDFAAAWPEPGIWQRLLPNLPWGQNLALRPRVFLPQGRCRRGTRKRSEPEAAAFHEGRAAAHREVLNSIKNHAGVFGIPDHELGLQGFDPLQDELALPRHLDSTR